MVQTAVWSAGFALFALLTAFKGWQPIVQGWGWPYWLVAYDDGFIRRGLVGTIVHLAMKGRSQQDLAGVILTVHAVCLVYIIAAYAGLAGRTAALLKGRERLVFLTLAGWIALAQVWASLAYTAGYLDIIVVAMSVGAALLLRRGHIVAAGVILAAGPLVHEYFVFFLPCILASAFRHDPLPRGEVRPLDYEPEGLRLRTFVILAAVCLIAAAAVTFGTDPAASAKQVAQMALPADQKAILLSVTFSQSLGQALGGMIGLLSAHGAFTAFNAAFFLLPSAVSCLGLAFWRTRLTPVTVVQIGAALFPIAALLIAWDLSRLLVLANASSGLLFLSAALWRAETPKAEVEVKEHFGALAALLLPLSFVGALLYGSLPMIYTYFPPGPIMMRYPLAVDAAPAAQAVERQLRFVWTGAGQDIDGDLNCQLTSTRPGAAAGRGCAWPVHEAETLIAPAQKLSRGRYRFEFQFDAGAACPYGRIAVMVGGPGQDSAVAKAGFATGGKMLAQLDVAIASDIGAGVVTKIVGVSGDGCAVLRRVSISPLRRSQ